MAVVQRVAADVEVLAVDVERRDLDPRYDADPGQRRGGRQRLVDAGDRVVIGQRQQLDPGGMRGVDHRGRRERAVAGERVRLEVEDGRHAAGGSIARVRAIGEP